MSRYTVLLKTLIEDERVKPLIDKALSSYPMYETISDNKEVKAIIPTRDELNQKLLNHYKYREIGFETIGRFLDELEITMNEIMPYYNQLYNTVEIMALIDDPFGNVDVTETYKQTRTGTGKTTDTGSDTTTSSGSGSQHSKTLESDTPQGNISKTASQIDSITHADKGNWNKTENENSATANTNTSSETNSETSETTEHTYTKKGNQGVNTYAHDMIEFRDSIIDVTNQIIEDVKIKDLFMQIF